MQQSVYVIKAGKLITFTGYYEKFVNFFGKSNKTP